MHLNHPETISHPLVEGKIVFHETVHWCRKDWGWLLLFSLILKICDVRRLPGRLLWNTTLNTLRSPIF